MNASLDPFILRFPDALSSQSDHSVRLIGAQRQMITKFADDDLRDQGLRRQAARHGALGRMWAAIGTSSIGSLHRNAQTSSPPPDMSQYERKTL
jgi:hypothetical protein